MKYTFRATDSNPTHVRDSDNVQGVLRSYPDSVVIRPISASVSPSDYTSIGSTNPAPVPHQIENWQARAILEIDGLLSDVDDTINALTGDTGIVVKAAWNSGAALVRSGSTVTTLAAALDLSSETVDDMFIRAAALTV